MRRGVLIILIIALAAWLVWAEGRAYHPVGGAASSLPTRTEEPDRMRFEWVREGGECRDRCGVLIAASGRIAETTASDFMAFLRGLDVRGATVALDSGGGLVDGGLALGRTFRRLGLATTVARIARSAPDANGQRRAVLDQRATCASMCVFALLGGVRRQVPDEARVLVHQIWPTKLREDALAASYSAGNMVRIQREVGQIARYTVEMGADIELFELAMRIPPWEALRPLTQQELRRMRVVTADAVATGSAGAPASPVALPIQHVALETETTDLPRGWTVVGHDRGALTRRHPLTIEGQEIGSFDISFTCGEALDAYQIFYSERRLAGAAAGTNDRLNRVLVTIARAPLALKIESSSSASPTELVSFARGLLPASLARALAAPEGSSLTVETSTTGKQRTTIRIGSTGLAEGFREIAAGCPK